MRLQLSLSFFSRFWLPLWIITVALLPTLAMAQATKPQTTKVDDKELARQIDTMLAATFQPDAPGGAVLVLRDGKPILRKGYGLANLELHVPVTPEMVFRLGSLTKQFTAVAILMLVEEGKVKLSDDITRYWPDYPTDGQKITVEQLLTHTSGIKNYTDLPEWFNLWRQDMTPDELIALFKDKPLDFTPGTRWAYSNSGYILLGALIEKVTGMSYEAFIQQRIFTPLGMAHAAYDQTERILPGRVSGYSRGEDGYLNAQYLSMSQPYAAGSLAASVDDLAKWDAALYTDKLVKQRTLQSAFKSFTLKDGGDTGYGYGFSVADYEGHTLLQHSGGINGFATYMLRLPDDKVYVALLTNCDNCPVPLVDLAFNIATLVIGKPYRDPAVINLPTSTLASYIGVYQFDEQTDLVIRQEGDQLVAQYPGIPPQPILPSAPTEFFIKDAMIRLRFVKDAAGKVSAVQVQEHFGPWRMARKSDKPLPAARQPIEIDPALYEQYIGEYQIAPSFSLTIAVNEGKLLVKPTGQDVAQLFPETETLFFLAVVDAQIEFVKDAAGKVTGLILHQGGQDMSGKKIK
ncbi:MAG: serine hydrolase [Caldilineaceae bacterium]